VLRLGLGVFDGPKDIRQHRKQQLSNDPAHADSPGMHLNSLRNLDAGRLKKAAAAGVIASAIARCRRRHSIPHVAFYAM
jgi:hypothetical protein